MKDYYHILGISPTATLADIKKAYRSKAQEFHPDKNDDPNAPRFFQEAKEAYECLSDEVARYAYDANRKRNLLEDPLAEAQQIWKNYLAEVVK